MSNLQSWTDHFNLSTIVTASVRFRSPSSIITDHVDCGLKLFVPRGFFFVFENNVAHRKVDSYFSCKVARLAERREAEQNSDGDDDGVNNRTSKQQAVASLKKDRILQNAWLSKQKPKDFFPSQSRITINFDPLKFL